MPVLVEALSIVIRTEAVLACYAGGAEALVEDCPNATLCTDGELYRAGFMNPADVAEYVAILEHRGLTFLDEEGKARDFVPADQEEGFTVPCDWAECFRSALVGGGEETVMACRLKEGVARGLAVPRGWNYANSLSRNACRLATPHLPEFLDFVRSEGGMDVYRDPETGVEHYTVQATAIRSAWIPEAGAMPG